MQAEVKAKDNQLTELRNTQPKEVPKITMPLRTMNSPIRQPIPSARENLVDSLETQLKAMTAERDMFSAKI